MEARNSIQIGIRFSGHRRASVGETVTEVRAVQITKGRVRHAKEPGLYHMDQGKNVSWGVDSSRCAFQEDFSGCSSLTMQSTRIPVNPTELKNRRKSSGEGSRSSRNPFVPVDL